MSSVTTNTELRTYYNTWVNKPPTEFPNEAFTPPNPTALWARFTILSGEELRMDIGTGNNSRTFRKSGVLVIQLFDSLNNGNNAILVKAEEVAAMFRDWCGVTVSCRAATVEELGNDNKGYYQVNISVPFKVDNIY
jgi:hypothetical protein